MARHQSETACIVFPGLSGLDSYTSTGLKYLSNLTKMTSNNMSLLISYNGPDTLLQYIHALSEWILARDLKN